MNAYSLDLRERVVAARQAGRREHVVANQFSVSVSFVAKPTARFRSSAAPAALPAGRRPAPGVARAALAELTACLRQTPDAIPDELRARQAAGGGPTVSRSAMGRAVGALDWRRTKK